MRRQDRHLSLNSPLLSLRYWKSAPEARFSAVVSKKNYARAVDRNKLKRRARAIFNKIKEKVPPYFYALFLKKGALEISYKELDKTISELFSKVR